MIVAQSQIHHRPHDDLTLFGDRALLNFVHSENSAFRGIEDRCAEKGTVNAAVRDGEDAALQILKADLPFAGLDRVANQIPLDLPERFLVAVAQDGNDQAALGTHGYSNVVVMILN